MKLLSLLFVTALVLATIHVDARLLMTVDNEKNLDGMKLSNNKNQLHTPRGSAHYAALESQFKSFRANFFHPETGLYNKNHKRADPRKISPTAVFADWRNTTGYINVLDFGAIADGITDNTNAFANALAAGAGGKVFVPAGSYAFASNGQGIQVPPYTTLAGVNSQAFSAWEGGTTLIVSGNSTNNAAAPAFVRLQGPDAGIQGMSIFYADQSPTAAAPNPFPPCIQGNGDNMFVSNMLLVNPTIGIDFATYPCGRHTIEAVYGQPLQVAVQVDQVYDIGRIRQCHFWPFFASYIPQNVMDNYIMQNGITFLFKRSDWEVVQDVFSWGYHVGMKFTSDPNTQGAHSCNGQFSNIDFDDVNVGIQIEATQPPGILFSDVNLANAGNGPNQVAINCPSTGTANIQTVVRGLSVWGQFTKAVQWYCGGKLSVSDFIINNWQRGGTAFDIKSGRVSILNGYFADVIGTAVNIDSSVDRAIVTGNDLVGNALSCNNANHMCLNNLA